MNEPDRPLRLRAVIRGAVQGVGFRPFVHRLAGSLGLAGWVRNTGEGVVVEVEGPEGQLRQFLVQVDAGRPPHSFIQSLEPTWLEPAGLSGFEIRPSPRGGPRSALVLPDIATCPQCLAEILDPRDRRCGYPFTNCTHCGPRFSIIERLPYDRANTSMRRFAMCPSCEAEFHDPADRRFHAQPNACPRCGPQLALWSPAGATLATREEALERAARALLDGQVVAVKGLGGFHLMVRADDPAAARRLRERKHREEKPFALLLPSLAAARDLCEVSELEARLLLSPEAPIVLLERRAAHRPAPATGWARPAGEAGATPGLPEGVMLPSNPLHHLLLRRLGVAVVATSGNLGDEPICTDENEALDRLSGIADLFLVHDRPIVRHVDDSIARVLLGRELVLRRARGYAPLPVPLPGALAAGGPVLAAGPQLKNTVAVAGRGRVVVSQHLGDLDTEAACAAFERAARDLQELFELPAARVACDLHPDYQSTRFAERCGLPVVRVQHHHAHALACMAENGVEPPALAVVWDGTGWGTDATIWGGEFLVVRAGGFERFAHLRTFPLPGGDAAAREPRRALAGALSEIGELARARPLFPGPAFRLLERMLGHRINTVQTSSAGRLVDAAAALLGIRAVATFEAQAAMELEAAAARAPQPPPTPPASASARHGPGPLVVDWEPWLRELIAAADGHQPPAAAAAAFHHRLAAAAVDVAVAAGLPRVVLSGGCFQNRILLERTVAGLRAAGLHPAWHQRVPPNDGGVALGQAVAACC